MDASCFLSVAAQHITDGFSTHHLARAHQLATRTDGIPKVIAASVLPSCLAVLTATANGAGRLMLPGKQRRLHQTSGFTCRQSENGQIDARSKA
jgi:hypothetical protein